MLTGVAAVSLTAAMTLAACGGSTGGQGATTGTAGSGAAVVAFSASDRKALPDLSGKTLDGSSLDVASLKGKVVVLNIWGAWCGPCQDEAPALEQVYETEKNAGKDIAFVGIDTRDQAAQAAAFVKDKQISYPNLFDGDSESILQHLIGAVPLNTTPTTVIVDRAGKIAWRALGAVDQKLLQGALDPILAEK
jgi:thiol-disulfide isomerase/thioredoxin